VIERDVYSTTIIKTTKPIYEHVVEAPRLRETIYQQAISSDEFGRSPRRGYSTTRQ
jgi:hypothetical protein